MEQLYQIHRYEIVEMLNEAMNIGFRKGLERSGSVCKYMSKNKAYKYFTRERVDGWINGGMITPKYNGNGKTSTILLDVSELMILDASKNIVIRKGYESKNSYS